MQKLWSYVGVGKSLHRVAYSLLAVSMVLAATTGYVLYRQEHIRLSGSELTAGSVSGMLMVQAVFLILLMSLSIWLLSLVQRTKNSIGLLEAEAKYRTLVESSLVGVYIIRDYRFTYVNPYMAGLFGYTAEEMLAFEQFDEFVAPEDKPLVRANIEKRLAGEVSSLHYEFRAVSRDGGLLYVEVYGSAQIIKGVPVLMGAMIDITDKKLYEAALQKASLEDALTGLCNRACFEARMRRLDSDPFLPYGIVVCDIDGLKLVNDTLGHQAGDLLLTSAAAVLSDCVSSPAVPARIGGDEFAIIVPGTNVLELERLCHVIQTEVGKRSQESAIPLFLSLGWAIGQVGTRSTHVFREADDRMYQYKEKNRALVRAYISQAISGTAVSK